MTFLPPQIKKSINIIYFYLFSKFFLILDDEFSKIIYLSKWLYENKYIYWLSYYCFIIAIILIFLTSYSTYTKWEVMTTIDGLLVSMNLEVRQLLLFFLTQTKSTLF